ncbi:hypothetical protein C8Q79DRAFT_680960 [Trametes meyenii]|nr:hypothetical protein C8Q79DRAFT_680960 [Trametes meyenii]
MFRLLSYTLRGVLAWNEDAPEPELASVVSEDTFYSESSQTEVSWTVSILDLDPEILRSVTRHLARKELSRLSQTCQALHRVLTLHLLTYGPITLNADTMDSFSHFMNRDSPDDERHSLLRSLTVHPLRGESKHGLTPLLLSFACEGILARASGLTSLTITDVARAFSPLQLHMIFDELPALQHLTLEGLPTGSEYKSILYESTAPLRTVTLAQGAWVPKDAATDAFELLRKHGATLTRITLRFLLPLPKWTLYHFPKPRVEEVRLSALQCSFADGVGWGYALASLFPNVRRVHVGRLCYNGLVLAARDTLGDPSKVSLARLVDDQRQHNHRMAEEHGECWRRLDVLAVGSVLELYHLGLSCTVHHLEFGALGGPLELGYACAALADVRPEKVGCTVRTRDLDGNLASFFEVVIAVDSMRRLILDLTDVAVSPFILGPQGRLVGY